MDKTQILIFGGINESGYVNAEMIVIELDPYKVLQLKKMSNPDINDLLSIKGSFYDNKFKDNNNGNGALSFQPRMQPN